MRRNRGTMKRLGTNRWLLRVYLGERAGKRRYSSKVLRGTTAQARNELTAMLRALDTKSFVAPSKKTLTEYLEAWLASKLRVAPRTLVDYRNQLGHFVASLKTVPKAGPNKGKVPQPETWDLGLFRLDVLDRDAIQKAINGMLEKGLSRRTLEYARSVLRTALEDAVKQDLLVRNPVKYTELPPKKKRPFSILSVVQMNSLIEKTKDDPLHGLWVVLLTTGLRPQEAFGLKWDDVDLEGRWLSVQRTVVNDGHGRLSLSDTTKTEGSRRRIGLAHATVEALKKHRAKQNEIILALGERYQKLGLVFPDSEGLPQDQNGVRDRWKKALKAAGLPMIRLYDTRHTHLTALLANGVDLAWVSDRAGHRDIKMTKDHYAHVLPETHRQMGELTQRLLDAAGGKRNAR